MIAVTKCDYLHKVLYAITICIWLYFISYLHVNVFYITKYITALLFFLLTLLTTSITTTLFTVVRLSQNVKMSKKVSKDLARFYAKLTPSNLAEGEREPPKGRKPETVTLDQLEPGDHIMVQKTRKDKSKCILSSILFILNISTHIKMMDSAACVAKCMYVTAKRDIHVHGHLKNTIAVF